MTAYGEDDRLFSSENLSDLLRARKAKAISAVNSIDANILLQQRSDLIVDELFEEHRIPRTCLNRNDMTGDVDETSVDISNDYRRHVGDRSRPFNIPGTRIELRIPFNGPKVFRLRPSRSSLNPPRARIEGNTLVLSCSIPSDVLEERRQAVIGSLHNEISKIEEGLTCIETDLDKWEPELRHAVEGAVQERRANILAMRDTEALLGVPIERDYAVAATYTVQVPKRRPLPRPSPRRTYEAFEPEPGISQQDFSNIVTDIGAVLAYFERLPLMPADASEERLRDQIVMTLNAIYGEASAESFSKRGKTDIYLPWENNAVFLAECKWWSGQKAFKDAALPQLLDRYIVWRDTHTAMVLFIKNRDASAVIAEAIESIEQHPRYVKEDAPIDRFRTFVLHQDGDEDRQLRLALLTAAIIP